MSSVAIHMMLLSDRARTAAYRRALRKTVRRGNVVLDLGCGSGFLGLLALRAGAARVHAVERHPIVHVAEALYRENGFGDRAGIHHCDIRDLRLREKVDVIVSDLIGHAGLNENVIELHRSALRFLKRGGRVVPRRIDLMLAPVSAPAEYRRSVQLGEADGCGVRLDTLRSLARHRPIPSRRLRRLARPALAGSVPLDRPPKGRRPTRLAARFRVSGTMHGVALWFRLDLAPGVRLDSWKGTHWIPFLFPLARPLRLRGARVSAELTLHPGNACSWTVRTPRESFVHDSDLGEESLFAGPRLDPGHVPVLPRDLRRLLPALTLMDGRRSIGRIAAALRRSGGLSGKKALGLVKQACLDFQVTSNGDKARTRT
ncbi:MAG: 50S ribosomal protein L11 methyltransferase [Planctomycetota bacterium]|jgi:SAM-dependent methyltransferase